MKKTVFLMWSVWTFGSIKLKFDKTRLIKTVQFAVKVHSLYTG